MLQDLYTNGIFQVNL
ncbi:UNVERIFIED_CONTAM: hypothetical protein NCL1_60210 [Trichonephila clavipes]